MAYAVAVESPTDAMLCVDLHRHAEAYARLDIALAKREARSPRDPTRHHGGHQEFAGANRSVARTNSRAMASSGACPALSTMMSSACGHTRLNSHALPMGA